MTSEMNMYATFCYEVYLQALKCIDLPVGLGVECCVAVDQQQEPQRRPEARLEAPSNGGGFGGTAWVFWRGAAFVG